MSVIGSLVVNVSANIGGFATGSKQVEKAAAEMVGHLDGMSVRFRTLRLAAGFVARAFTAVVGEMHRLDEESQKTGKSIEELSNGALTKLDVDNIHQLGEAFHELVQIVEHLAGGVLSQFLTQLADSIDPSILTLARANIQIEKIEKSRAEQQEKIAKASQAKQLEDQRAFLAARKRAAEELKALEDKNFTAQHGEEAGRIRKYVDNNAPDQEEYRRFLAALKQEKELEAAKEAAAEAEKKRAEDLKKAEDAAAHAREDAEKRAAALIQDTLTPQEKYIEKLWEIHNLAKEGLIDDETWGRARKAALEERDKAMRVETNDDHADIADGAGAVNRGSQEAFSALARFSRGEDQKDVPKKSLKELQSINRELIRQREKQIGVLANF